MKIVALTIEMFDINMNIQNTNLPKHPGLFLKNMNILTKYYQCVLYQNNIPFNIH